MKLRGAYSFPHQAAILPMLVCIIAMPTHAAERHAQQAVERAAAADAQLAWTLQVPLGFTTHIESYELVEGVVYANGSDGRARAIDAATGRYMWSTDVTTPGQTIRGPVSYHFEGMNAAVFTTFSEAVFIDTATGIPLRRVRLSAPPTASVCVFEKSIFIPSVGNRVCCDDLDHGTPKWQIGTRGALHVPPIYIPEEDLLVIADDAGYIHGSDSDRHRHFTQRVGGEPKGWLAIDSGAIYITTAGDAPDIHALNRETGQALREPYPLAGRPAGGPVVTKGSLYQALSQGGVHRISLTPESPGWFNPNARTFLAEWPHRTAVLRMDGRIEVIESTTRRSAGMIDAGVSFPFGLSNAHNDAAIVATRDGGLWCFRPAGAGALDVSTFHPATTQPTTRPVHTRPAKDTGGSLITLHRTTATPAPRAAAPPPAGPAGLGPAPAPPQGQLAPPAPPGNETHSQRRRVQNQIQRAIGQQQQQQPQQPRRRGY